MPADDSTVLCYYNVFDAAAVSCSLKTHTNFFDNFEQLGERPFFSDRFLTLMSSVMELLFKKQQTTI